MSLWELLIQVAIANFLTFGNGNVMAAIFQQVLVQQAHVLTNEQLLYAFSLGRVTPGQANLYVASIGYMLYGFPGAVLCMLVIAVPSYLMIPLLRSYEYVRGNVIVLNMTRGLGSTAVGVLLATTWNLSKDSLGTPLSWGVFAITLALLLFTRLPTFLSLAAGSGLGVAAALLTRLG